MKYNRFTCPSKKERQKDFVTIIILSSRIEYRKKTIGIKSFYVHNSDLILNHQLNKFEFLNGSEKIICLGEDLEKNKNKLPNDVRIVENINFNSTNTVEDLRLCLNNCTSSRVVILDGGVIPSKKISQINLNQSYLITNKNINKKHIGVNICKEKITTFNYAHKNKWSGIAYLIGKDLEVIKKLCTKENNKFVLHEILEMAIDAGVQFHNFEDEELIVI